MSGDRAADQVAKLNQALLDLADLGEAAGPAGSRTVGLVVGYVAALERAAPAVALKYRGANALHVTDDAQVVRTDPADVEQDEHTATGQAMALAHVLAASPNAADRIVCALDPADLLAFRAASADLLALVDRRASQLVQWRRIGPTRVGER